MFIQHWYI